MLRQQNSKMVYVFEYVGRYKIGATNNIERRLLQLSCGCPNIICIYRSGSLSNAYNVERILHRMFDEYNVGGEWFSRIDLEEIRSAVEKSGREGSEKHNEVRRKSHGVDISDIVKKVFPDYYESKREDLERIRNENIQIEKFMQSVRGADVPNVYSDLIYDTLFGYDTEGLVRKYNPKRFESFRAKLTEGQNAEIDNLTKLVGSLVNLYWSYEDIKELVRSL